MNKQISRALAKGICLLLASGSSIAEEGGGFDDLYKITTEQQSIDAIPTSVLSDVAFQGLKEEMFPETAEQIKEIQQIEQDMINALYDKKEPTALTEILTVSTKPGAKPVTVYLAPLTTSQFSIIDSTGEPWPVQLAKIGNGTDYIGGKVTSHEFNNALEVSTKRQVGSTNLILTLEGNSIPIYVKLRSSVDKYHPIPILMIDREGPKAKVRQVSSVGAVKTESLMKDLVLGIVPDHFKKMVSSDSNVDAWVDDKDLYLRTKYSPSSPLARSMTYGYGGYGAFKMNRMPIIFMTDDVRGYEKRIVFTEGAR